MVAIYKEEENSSYIRNSQEPCVSILRNGIFSALTPDTKRIEVVDWALPNRGKALGSRYSEPRKGRLHQDHPDPWPASPHSPGTGNMQWII